MSGTVLEALDRAVSQWGERPALKTKRGGIWEATTWKDYSDQAHQVARGFLSLGLEAGRGVSIIGYNRPKWFLADMGAIIAGGVPAGIYTTCAPEQCQYITHHSEAQIAVVENAEQLAKFKQVMGDLPQLKAIVMMEGSDEADNVYSWDELLAQGADVPDEDLQARKDAQQEDDLCTLIYTSGTTGPPKAVMMTHKNFTWTSRALVDHVGGMSPNDNTLCYLPLSHVAEQLLALHMPMQIGACSWFLQNLELLGDTLREVRPAYFLGVPRVWEKIQAKIVAAAAQNSGLKKKIGLWAKGVGLRAGYAEQRGEPRPLLYGLANKLVFSKVRALLGLDRCKIAVSSTAPIAKDTLEFFLSLGIPLSEVYGMSECTGPSTICTPWKYRTGKAGYAIPGTEIRIAEDGEICMRGPHVFAGYYNNEKATKETLDEDGWLYSGDIGQLDDEGFVQVTDRKKELIITAGGKNIAPTLIEGTLKSIPVVSQAVVIGDRRKFLSALITLDPERLDAEVAEAGLPAGTDMATAAASEPFNAHLMKKIEAACSSFSRVEQVRKITILPRELTEDEDELTPTLKLKRRIINDKYAEVIEAIYA